jgi:hypothetical protein
MRLAGVARCNAASRSPTAVGHGMPCSYNSALVCHSEARRLCRAEESLCHSNTDSSERFLARSGLEMTTVLGPPRTGPGLHANGLVSQSAAAD